MGKAIIDSVIKAGKTIVLKPDSFLNSVSGKTTNGIDVKIGKRLFKEIEFYKNVVKPELKDSIEELSKTYTALSSKDPFDYVIDILEIPDFITTMKSRAVIVNAQGNYNDSATNLNLNLSRREILDLYKGTDRLETEWTAFVSSFSDEELSYAMDKYLTTISGTTLQFTMLEVKYSWLVYGILYMIADDYTNSILNSEIKHTSRILGSVINYELERLEGYNRDNILIAASGDKNIIVMSDVYERFLEKDGSADILVGLMITGMTLTHAEEILSVSERCLDTYAKARNEKKVINAIKLENEYSDAFVNHFISLIALIEDGDKNYPSDIKDTGVDKVRDYINSVPNTKLADVTTMCKEVYTDIIYSQTNLKAFYMYADGYLKDNPTMSMAEAASYAGMELITDLVLTQIEVK